MVLRLSAALLAACSGPAFAAGAPAPQAFAAGARAAAPQAPAAPAFFGWAAPVRPEGGPLWRPAPQPLAARVERLKRDAERLRASFERPAPPASQARAERQTGRLRALREAVEQAAAAAGTRAAAARARARPSEALKLSEAAARLRFETAWLKIDAATSASALRRAGEPLPAWDLEQEARRAADAARALEARAAELVKPAAGR